MLVLTRKKGQTILIGPDGPDQIIVKLVQSQDGSARIGIEAPRSLRVIRSEIKRAGGRVLSEDRR